MIKNRKPILLKVMMMPKVFKWMEDNMEFAEKTIKKKRVRAMKLAPAAGVLKTMPKFLPWLINFPLHCY